MAEGEVSTFPHAGSLRGGADNFKLPPGNESTSKPLSRLHFDLDSAEAKGIRTHGAIIVIAFKQLLQSPV